MTSRHTRRRRPVSAQGMARLEHWAGRKPCIALMGEFSAGKTTLTNFLLGEDVLPTRVTATQLPPVWMSYGEPQAWYVDAAGARHDLAFEDLYNVPVEGVRYIRLFCKGRILETIDLIDTPGISDPNIPKAVWEMAVGYVNAVMWCTHSTQAWRESERSAWDSLPQRLRANSILLATRSDKLMPVERERVARRLRREAGAMFKDIVMFSAMDALRAVSDPEAEDLWTESGGAALLAALQDIAANVIEARRSMLSRYVPEGADSEPARVLPGRALRPVRAEGAAAPGRARLSRDDANDMRHQLLDEPPARPAAGRQQTAEVLHLSFAQRIPVAAPVNDPAVTDPVEPAADSAAPEWDETLERADGPDTALQMAPAEDAGDAAADIVADAAEDGVEAEAADEPEAEAAWEDGVMPGGAVELWRAVVASGPTPATVADMLDLMERFLAEVDRRDAEAAAQAAAEEAEENALRRHG